MKLKIFWFPEWDLQLENLYFVVKTQNNYEIKLVIYKYNIYLEEIIIMTLLK